MKKDSVWFVAIAGLTLTATLMPSLFVEKQVAIAQDESCYMITSSGKRVSLGKLCNRSGSFNPSSKNFHQARIKRRDGGTPVIDVTFNGNQTFEMLLDTGATGSLITRSMARSLQVPIVGAGQFIMADGRSIMLPVGRLNSMSIDGATVRNVNVVIANDSAEGLLGHDFLGNYDIKIKQDVVEFYPR
jgi:aspartyl protease family protein